MTRQSMGELVRELVDLGILEMVPDPDDGRAKLVTYSKEGKVFAAAGLRHLRAIEDRLRVEFGERLRGGAAGARAHRRGAGGHPGRGAGIGLADDSGVADRRSSAR